MPALLWTELLGYLASLLILASLVMRSVLRLRVINTIGAAVFTIYGLLIRAYPVAVVNFLIFLVDVYYLYGFFTAREKFTLLEVQPGSEYLRHFLEHHAAEIRRFQPDFIYQPAEDLLSVFTLRNAVPAGVLVGRKQASGQLDVLLDYVVPDYRDFKTARFLFSQQADFFRQRGIRQVCSSPGAPAHERYLQRTGFARAGELYCLNIDSE